MDITKHGGNTLHINHLDGKVINRLNLYFIFLDFCLIFSTDLFIGFTYDHF